MPLMNGRETLSCIKTQERYDRIPVVVVSTSNNEADHTYFKGLNVRMFLKPYCYSDLQPLVIQLLKIGGYLKTK
jgi:CheY-like chemotaxis protein